MCGISGIIAKNKLTPELRETASRMSSAQIHRGPDGNGEFNSENVALHSRRLSIIDPIGGSQPLINEDRSIALLINGEIYNYVELRAELKASGHTFRTDTDSEVVLHLYEDDGLDFVNRLRGMFSFALWDNNRRRLILARDRMGEKPLYLYQTSDQLLFASELKGLLHSGIVPFELDAKAVNLYFHYQYIPEPMTAIKGVRKLDAGRMVIVDAEPWNIEEKAYWSMKDAPILEGEPIELVRQKLDEVSKLVVRADVPVGVALSGGLDSSVVAAFAAREHPALSALSVGYAGSPESDERADASRLARHLKIPFFDVELDTRSVVDFFPELNYWRDDPIADISGFGYFAVMRLARELGIPVMLQGQGGDELFWGYPELRRAKVETRKKAALLRRPISQSVLQSLRFVPPNGFSLSDAVSWARDFGGVRTARSEVRRRMSTPDRPVFYDSSPDFASAAAEISAYYHPTFAAQIPDDDAYSPFTFHDGAQASDIDLTSLVCATYLRENGIAQGDRLGMASSVEMRLPLVDHRLIETVIGLRKKRSDASLPPKHWLREAVKDVLPDWVLARPKRGFEPPTREWHRAIFAEHGDSLKDGYLVGSGILSREGAEHLARGEFPVHSITPLSFKALVLEQWCRQMRQIL